MNVSSAEADRGASALDELVGYSLRWAHNRLMADLGSTLEPLGLRPVHFAMMVTIRETPGLIQTALGSILGIQRGNLVPLVNHLLGLTLVHRLVSPSDRRALMLRLTAEGEALLEEALALVRKHEERMLKRLSRREQQMLGQLLAKIGEE